MPQKAPKPTSGLNPDLVTVHTVGTYGGDVCSGTANGDTG